MNKTGLILIHYVRNRTIFFSDVFIALSDTDLVALQLIIYSIERNFGLQESKIVCYDFLAFRMDS